MFAEESRHALHHVVAVGQYISAQIFEEHVAAELFVCFFGKAPHKAGERLCFLYCQQLRHHQYVFGRDFLRQHLKIPFPFRLCHFLFPPNFEFCLFRARGEGSIGREKGGVLRNRMRKSTGKAKSLRGWRTGIYNSDPTILI